MEINFLNYLQILLLLLPALDAASPSESCRRVPTDDGQCGAYCHQALKPLLGYAALMRSKEEKCIELQKKFAVKETELNIFKELLLQKNASNELIALYKNNNDQLMGQLKEINAKLKVPSTQQRDYRLNSNVANSKQLESKLSEYKELLITSICQGKPTVTYSAKIPEMGKFSVACDSDLAGAGWIVIQRRINGSVGFNRGWNEYKEGFGNLRGEFFIGLEKLHLLTKSHPHELYIHLEDFSNQTRYAKYSHFLIGNETESYKLKLLGMFDGNVKDSFTIHLNHKFSTADRDNDIATGHCAYSYQSGWWFTDCYNCNLNGRYTSEDVGILGNRIAWNGWKIQPMKFVQMMIRAKSSSFN